MIFKSWSWCKSCLPGLLHWFKGGLCEENQQGLKHSFEFSYCRKQYNNLCEREQVIQVEHGGWRASTKIAFRKRSSNDITLCLFSGLVHLFLSVFNSARHTEEGQDCNLCPWAFGMQHRSVCKFIDCEWESCYLELGCLKRWTVLWRLWITNSLSATPHFCYEILGIFALFL